MVRMKSKEKKEKGDAREMKLEEENVKDVSIFWRAEGEKVKLLANLDLDEVLQGYVEGAKKRKRNSDSTIKKRKKRSKGGKVTMQQLSMNNDENKEKERKVKVTSLPVPALEKVFSYLDWNDLGRAMLVCRRWYEVGGHPSLWNEFHLQLSLSGQGLKGFAKIRRLAWVKSVQIRLSGKGFENHATSELQTVIHHWTRLEEVFLFAKEDIDDTDFDFFEELDILESYCMQLVRADSNMLIRIGANYKFDGIDGKNYLYFISSCDSATNTFIKKTLVGKGKSCVSLHGLAGITLSYEVLKTICTTFKQNTLIFNTNLMIDQNIDPINLKDLLKHHVTYMNWEINEEDLENQGMAPINAILDVLGSKDPGVFHSLTLPKDLLLKSHWVQRLGGRVKVEGLDGDNPFLTTVHTKSGLEILDIEVGEDEDESEDEEESEDEDEDEDNFENVYDHEGEEGDQKEDVYEEEDITDEDKN